MSAVSAEVDYEEGLRLVPRLINQGRLDTAARWAGELCRHKPDDPRPHNQAGLVQQRQGRPAAAVAHFRRAVILEPDAAKVWSNLGTALRHLADPRGTFQSRLRAMQCRPDLPEARLAVGLSLLAAGDYRTGFAEHEHRPERALILTRYSQAGLPQWQGDVREAGRLLVLTEQGAGDVIQFLRFVQPLAEAGVEVTVACAESLRRLVGSAPGVAATASKWPTERLGEYDGVELLMSLPARLGVDLASLPVPTRYVEPPASSSQVPAGGRPKIGLCWSGSERTALNDLRRIPFRQLAAVLDVPGCSFFALQVQGGREELDGDARVTDLAPLIDDFADTAAMIEQMDLVITVDTSVAHIAGALGKPVWTMLARVADWRWGYDVETSPWYPSMRLFRQSRTGDWSDVVDRVVAALREASGEGRGGLAPAPFASPDPTG